MSKSKAKLKTIIFTRKPPKSAYFVGTPQQVPEDQAEEYIKLGFATDPEAEAKKEEAEKAKKENKAEDKK